MNRISSERFERLTWWEDHKDQKLQKKKSIIERIITNYEEENLIIAKYLNEVPFVQLVDAYIQSDTKGYEPGELKDIGTVISNELEKVWKNQSFEDEDNSLAFYIIRELGEG